MLIGLFLCISVVQNFPQSPEISTDQSNSAQPKLPVLTCRYTHTHTLASSVSAHNCTFPTLIFYSIHIPLLFPSLSPFLFVSLPAVSRSPKPDDPALAGPSYLDTSSSSIASATPKSSGPTPLFTVDGEEEDDYYTIFFLQNCHLLKFFLCLIYDFCSFLYLLISICLLLSFSLAFSE